VIIVNCYSLEYVDDYFLRMRYLNAAQNTSTILNLMIDKLSNFIFNFELITFPSSLM